MRLKFQIPCCREVVRWPLSRLGSDQEARIIRDLTLSNGQYFAAQKRGLPTGGVPATFAVYRQEDRHLVLPRHIPWSKYYLPAPEPCHSTAQRFKVEFSGAIRADQEAAYEALLVQVRSGMAFPSLGDGILSLACGKGKTVLSIAAWAYSCMPGLAIVPTLQIASQWVERLLEFTDLHASEIGMVGDGQCSWEGRKFVVATIQTLSKKVLPAAFYRYFGTVFFDECHRLGAPDFSIVGSQFHGTRIGLSATWKRADGLEKMFLYHLGEVFFEDRQQELTPEIWFVKTDTALDLKKFRMWRRGGRGEINFAKVITTLSRDEARRQQVVDLVRRAYDADRKILVLGDRKEELVALRDALDPLVGHDVGLCVGSLDGRSVAQDDRDEALARAVVFATSQLVREGLDQADLDSLVILYPKSNAAFAEQAVGRILRRWKGKNHPLVIVLHDHGCFIDQRGRRSHPFTAMCSAMQRTYKGLGYTISRVV